MLAGDDEFHADLNRPTTTVRQPTGTFDSPDTFASHCFLGAIAFLAVVHTSRRWVARQLIHAVLFIGFVIASLGAVRAWTDDDGPLSNFQRVRPVVADSPLLGTGAGNWARMTGTPDEPKAAWAALLGTLGPSGLALCAGALLFALTFLVFRRPVEPEAEPRGRPRWEFHLGGIAGLVLGFIWAAGAIPAEAPTNEIFRLATTALFRPPFDRGLHGAGKHQPADVVAQIIGVSYS